MILLNGWPDTSRPGDTRSTMPLLVDDVIGILDALDIDRAHVGGDDWDSGVGSRQRSRKKVTV